MTGILYLSGTNTGEYYVLRADRVAGIRRLDHEPIGGVGASYEVLVVGIAEPFRVDEDSARRVEDYLVSLANEDPPKDS